MTSHPRLRPTTTWQTFWAFSTGLRSPTNFISGHRSSLKRCSSTSWQCRRATTGRTSTICVAVTAMLFTPSAGCGSVSGRRAASGTTPCAIWMKRRSIYSSTSRTLTQLRRFGEALQTFRKARKMFETEENSYWIGLLDLYRAEVHLSAGRLWEAQALATQARPVFERLGIASKRIASLVLVGRVAMALNDLAAAQTAANEISDLIETTKTPLVLFPYHVLCGEIAERERKWNEAQHHFELAATDLERHQARIHHDDLRVTFFKGRHQPYDALVRLSLDQANREDGLALGYSWCERARSRGLIELLSHYAPAMRGHAEQSLVMKINRLREELNSYYARLKPESRPVTAQPNYATIAIKESELARALREISGADPEYASLQQVSIATIDSVRRILPETTTLVERSE